MTSKELKQQIAKLKAKAQAILQAQEERNNYEGLTYPERAKKFLTNLFTCADPLEIWMPYPENKDYMVSSEGRVKSIKYGKEVILSANDTGKGYMAVRIFENGEGRMRKVHQLVAETFLMKEREDLQVNHINHNRADNRLSNLEYLTARENKAHSRKKDCTSNYVGVCWASSRNKWKAQITFEGTTKHLGYFVDELEAAQAYKDFINEHNIENKYATV